jgi:NitT/TauT family transport system substrate-binding protein
MYWKRSLLVASAALLVAAACNSPAASPSPSASASGVLEKTTLTVGNLRVLAISSPYLVQDLGYFAAEGLTVNFVDTTGGAAGIAAMEGGSLDMSSSPYFATMQARERGLDLVTLMTSQAYPANPPHEAGTIARADDNSIKTFKDLEGKTVATDNLKSTNWMATAYAVKKAGGDYNKVKWVELPAAQQVDALMAKQVDATQTNDPFKSTAVASGKAKVIGYPYNEIAPNLDIGSFVVLRKFAQANPNTVKAFVRAMKRGNQWITDNPDEAHRKMAAAAKVDPASLAGVSWGVYPQKANLAALKTFGQAAVDFGFLKTAPDLNLLLWETAY